MASVNRGPINKHFGSGRLSDIQAREWNLAKEQLTYHYRNAESLQRGNLRVALDGMYTIEAFIPSHSSEVRDKNGDPTYGVHFILRSECGELAFHEVVVDSSMISSLNEMKGCVGKQIYIINQQLQFTTETQRELFASDFSLAKYPALTKLKAELFRSVGLEESVFLLPGKAYQVTSVKKEAMYIRAGNEIWVSIGLGVQLPGDVTTTQVADIIITFDSTMTAEALRIQGFFHRLIGKSIIPSTVVPTRIKNQNTNQIIKAFSKEPEMKAGEMYVIDGVIQSGTSVHITYHKLSDHTSLSSADKTLDDIARRIDSTKTLQIATFPGERELGSSATEILEYFGSFVQVQNDKSVITITPDDDVFPLSLAFMCVPSSKQSTVPNFEARILYLNREGVPVVDEVGTSELIEGIIDRVK